MAEATPQSIVVRDARAIAMETYYKYILDMIREQGDRYRRQTQQLIIYRPYVWLRQRGSTNMYQFEKNSGQGGPLTGDNFFTDLCLDDDPRWRDLDIEYDYVTDSWIIGDDGDPDFLIYMHIVSRGNRVDNLIADEELRGKLVAVYTRYALDGMARAVAIPSRGWCTLF